MIGTTKLAQDERMAPVGIEPAEPVCARTNAMSFMDADPTTFDSPPPLYNGLNQVHSFTKALPEPASPLFPPHPGRGPRPPYYILPYSPHYRG